MPVIYNNSFLPSRFIRNPHLQTILPQYFKPQIHLNCLSKRIELEDGDFLDLDYYSKQNKKLAIISHGLEGHSRRYYVRSCVKTLAEHGYDVVAWNMRSCSREENRLPRFYHSGETVDLLKVIQFSKTLSNYNQVDLIGYSVGGNITLKLLGELGKQAVGNISRALVYSVPCDLKGSAIVLAQIKNKIYMRHFIKSLHKKMHLKAKKFPGQIDLKVLSNIQNFCQFDEAFTAPIHGFKDADDYWEKCSAIKYISDIKIPTKLITALDDPFLSKTCYPTSLAEGNNNFTLELSKYGGHLGFVIGLIPFSTYLSSSLTKFLIKNS